jgi:hypothetical protein
VACSPTQQTFVKDRHERHLRHASKKDLQIWYFAVAGSVTGGVTVMRVPHRGRYKETPANTRGVTIVTVVTMKCSLYLLTSS